MAENRLNGLLRDAEPVQVCSQSPPGRAPAVPLRKAFIPFKFVVRQDVLQAGLAADAPAQSRRDYAIDQVVEVHWLARFVWEHRYSRRIPGTQAVDLQALGERGDHGKAYTSMIDLKRR